MKKFTYDQNGHPYHLHGAKHTCPSCGRNTLQLYIGMDSGEPINDQVGKCDRKYNCAYDYKPKAYFADHPDELPPAKDGRRYPRPAQESKKPLVTIPKEYVLKSIIPSAKKGMCSFTDILLQMFQPADVQRVINTYYLGRDRYGATVFWQLDERGMVREGKVMMYNAQTGSRNKESWATGESYWAFSTLQARGILPKAASSTKCMFGQHLLRNVNKTTNVMITESEKNCIFGSLAFPKFTWLAVGSSQDIGKLWKVKDTLAKCRSVVVVPDADAIPDWREKVKELNLPNMKVSNLCAGHAGGWDIADMIRDIYLRTPQRFTAAPSPTPAPAPSPSPAPSPTPSSAPSSTPAASATTATGTPATAAASTTPAEPRVRYVSLFPQPYHDILSELDEEQFNAIFSPAAVAKAMSMECPF